MFSSLGLKFFRFSCFQKCRFGRDQRSKLNNYTFSKKDFCYGSCKYVSTLRKKIFSVAEVKCFRLQGSNYSDFLVFGNASLGKIKGHSLTTIPFQKIFLVGMKVSGMCLPYVKRLFSSGTSQVSFSLGLKLHRFCCFQESQFVIDRRSQFENNRFFKSFLL